MAKKPADNDDAIPQEVARLSFEAAMAALEEIVRQLEAGEVGLEDSIAMYSRGAALKRHCEDKLRAASERIEKIIIGPDGAARGSEAADID